jgi:hypothetical protein
MRLPGAKIKKRMTIMRIPIIERRIFSLFTTKSPDREISIKGI